jgi:(p)ppGpp synthase/HD superfamily hydrolase
MTTNHLIDGSALFAQLAHDAIGQVRKGNGKPYWTHTQAVAAIVAKVTDDAELIAAANLHDVREDVEPEEVLIPRDICESFGLDPDKRFIYGIGAIEALFGTRVASLVVELSNIYTKDAYPAFNRDARHALERERLAKVSDDAKFIKLADLLHNSQDIQSLGAFGRKWLGEKKELLPKIKVEGDTRNEAMFALCQESVDKNLKLFGK